MLTVLGVSSPLPRSNSLIFFRFLSRLLGISSYSTLPSALFPFGIQFVDHHAPLCFLPLPAFCFHSPSHLQITYLHRFLESLPARTSAATAASTPSPRATRLAKL